MKFIHLLTVCLFALCLSSCSSESTGNSNSDETTFPMITKPTHMFVGGYTRDEGWVNGNGTGFTELASAKIEI